MATDITMKFKDRIWDLKIKSTSLYDVVASKSITYMTDIPVMSDYVTIEGKEIEYYYQQNKSVLTFIN